MSEDAAARLQDIAERVRLCQECGLYQGTTNAVPGSGSATTDIVFIG